MNSDRSNEMISRDHLSNICLVAYSSCRTHTCTLERSVLRLLESDLTNNITRSHFQGKNWYQNYQWTSSNTFCSIADDNVVYSNDHSEYRSSHSFKAFIFWG